jgi:transposase
MEDVMPKLLRPDGKRQVYTFSQGNRLYAAVQKAGVDNKTGKFSPRRTLYGKVKDNVFFPNRTYLLAPSEERATLAFPEAWDLSLIHKSEHSVPASVPVKAGRPKYVGRATRRFYGAILFLERVTDAIGLRPSLKQIFEGEESLVDDFLTLAYYQILSNDGYSYVEPWQRIHKAPSERVLVPSAITQLTKLVDEQMRTDFFSARRSRSPSKAYLAVDSTSFSYYGNSLCQAKSGHNKEHDELPQVNVLLVYDQDDHAPLYYQKMPGNIPDSRSVKKLLKKLDDLGFKDVTYIFDRGYFSKEGIDILVKRKCGFLMGMKIGLNAIGHLIKANGKQQMTRHANWIDGKNLYGVACTLDWSVMVVGEKRAVDPLTAYLYYDQASDAIESKHIQSAVTKQRLELQAIVEDGDILEASELKKYEKYFTVSVNTGTKKIISYSVDVEKLDRELSYCGYFALIGNRKETAQEAIEVYSIRDDQEKCFTLEKSFLNGRRLRTSTELTTDGRLFLQFISLILCTYIRRVMREKNLFDTFTMLGLFRELESIECTEQEGKAKVLSEFVGKQIAIFDAFGFEIPKDCRPSTPSRKPRKIPKKAL